MGSICVYRHPKYVSDHLYDHSIGSLGKRCRSVLTRVSARRRRMLALQVRTVRLGQVGHGGRHEKGSASVSRSLISKVRRRQSSTRYCPLRLVKKKGRSENDQNTNEILRLHLVVVVVVVVLLSCVVADPPPFPPRR